jgi:hypothetical protein
MVEELICRSGSPTTRSLSPYDGMLKLVRAQIPGHGLNLICKLISTEDFDADVKKPIAGRYTEVKPANAKILRRLEDIDESWVQHYINTRLTGLKQNELKGLREYDSKHPETRTLVNSEGETAEESELLIDYNTHSVTNVAEAKAKLPYLLKRLNDKSISLKVSALSLIIAYESVRASGTIAVKPGQMGVKGIYTVNSKGDIVDRIDNTSPLFGEAFKWVQGINSYRDAYFSDAIELIHVCKVLGVDIAKEDPLEFQGSNIEKLRVTYMVKNKDYMSTAHRCNYHVLSSLSNIKLADYVVKPAKEQPISVQVASTIQAVMDCENAQLNRLLKEDVNKEAVNSMLSAYGKATPTFRIKKNDRRIVPMLEDLITLDGFLYKQSDRARPLIFNIGAYRDIEIVSDIAIAHVTGTLFIVNEGYTIYYLPVKDFEECLTEGIRKKWSTCVI